MTRRRAFDPDDPRDLERAADLLDAAASSAADRDQLVWMIHELRTQLRQRDLLIRRLRGKLRAVPPKSDSEHLTADHVLEALHEVIDVGLSHVFGEEAGRPWASETSPKPPRMSADQLRALRRASIARARAAKTVGFGQGRVQDRATQMRLIDEADRLAESAEAAQD